MVRRGEVPVVGDGAGVWSWVHIDDAAAATADALTIPAGVYHVVDDDPSPVSVWLPAFARAVGAPPPPRVTVEQALAAAGEDAVYYGTKLRGRRTRRRSGRSGSTPARWSG
jgi:nucleoside-diphosphate-sugar epimerase